MSASCYQPATICYSSEVESHDAGLPLLLLAGHGLQSVEINISSSKPHVQHLGASPPAQKLRLRLLCKPRWNVTFVLEERQHCLYGLAASFGAGQPVLLRACADCRALACSERIKHPRPAGTDKSE